MVSSSVTRNPALASAVFSFTCVCTDIIPCSDTTTKFVSAGGNTAQGFAGGNNSFHGLVQFVGGDHSVGFPTDDVYVDMRGVPTRIGEQLGGFVLCHAEPRVG